MRSRGEGAVGGAGARGRGLTAIRLRAPPVGDGGARLPQVLGRHQRLAVLLLVDGEHDSAHTLRLPREVGVARGEGLSGRGAGLAVLGRVQKAEAGRREARAPQVADGVEPPLPLGRLAQGVRGGAGGRVPLPTCLQVSVREDLTGAVATGTHP